MIGLITIGLVLLVAGCAEVVGSGSGLTTYEQLMAERDSLQIGQELSLTTAELTPDARAQVVADFGGDISVADLPLDQEILFAEHLVDDRAVLDSKARGMSVVATCRQSISELVHATGCPESEYVDGYWEYSSGANHPGCLHQLEEWDGWDYTIWKCHDCVFSKTIHQYYHVIN